MDGGLLCSWGRFSVYLHGRGRFPFRWQRITPHLHSLPSMHLLTYAGKTPWVSSSEWNLLTWESKSPWVSRRRQYLLTYAGKSLWMIRQNKNLLTHRHEPVTSEQILLFTSSKYMKVIEGSDLFEAFMKIPVDCERLCHFSAGDDVNIIDILRFLQI